MAGLSQRFSEAGYSPPKYMLEAGGKSLFRHAVEGFSYYFGNLPFLFVLRDVQDSLGFVREECAKLGLDRPLITVLSEPTRGQAETVMLGLEDQSVGADDPLSIFNIDTFRPGFRFPKMAEEPWVDGYLEVFRGSGANWSYVGPAEDDPGRVAKTAEKNEISDLCCTGLYHFAKAGFFTDAFRQAALPASTDEFYIAPLYNFLIGAGSHIRFDLIGRGEVIFCGVPEEYEMFREKCGDGRV
jgi:hypothetical protein